MPEEMRSTASERRGRSESFFRLDVVQAGLTGSRIGSRHRQFEIQVARLEKLVNEGEHIGCIFLGNLMVWLGVSTLVVNQTFQEKNGTFARDYAIPADAEDAYVVSDTPWLENTRMENLRWKVNCMLTPEPCNIRDVWTIFCKNEKC